jgi:hypothetical protein
VLIPLPQALDVTPGHTYVLDVANAQDYYWYATCGQVDGVQCDHVDPDAYPAGQSNYPNQDFYFRTYELGGASPTPVPTPFNATLQFGNVDCQNGVQLADALGVLYYLGEIQQAQTDCFPYAEDMFVNGELSFWGDLNCNLSVEPRDAIRIIQYIALLTPEPTNCPDIGESVTVSSSPP